MKAENRLKILEFIEDSAQLIDDILFIFSQPYGRSFSRTDYLLQKRQGRWRGALTDKQGKQTHLRFNDLVYRLKKDGLVCKVHDHSKCFLSLTSKGKRILEGLRLIQASSLPSRNYENEEDDTLKIITFDVPESERKKRDWLRGSLKTLKFKMIQRSVWAGKRGLPERFMDDIRRMNLLPFVEIFSVNKKGSLVQFKP